VGKIDFSILLAHDTTPFHVEPDPALGQLAAKMGFREWRSSLTPIIGRRIKDKST